MTNKAVVIGGSIAGLLSACALAETFDDVLVLERGEFSEEAAVRTSVPQGAHAHGVLAGGLRALEALLPGLTEELLQRGCPSGDILREAAWVFGGLRLAIGDSGVRGMTLGRPLLEHVIRERVRALRNVRIQTNGRCGGLIAADARIVGVRASIDGVDQQVAADLAVDASGRNSKLTAWLFPLGFAPPAVDEVELETHFVSRVFLRLPLHLAGGFAVVVVSYPLMPLGGIAVALDERRW